MSISFSIKDSSGSEIFTAETLVALDVLDARNIGSQGNGSYAFYNEYGLTSSQVDVFSTATNNYSAHEVSIQSVTPTLITVAHAAAEVFTTELSVSTPPLSVGVTGSLSESALGCSGTLSHTKSFSLMQSSTVRLSNLYSNSDIVVVRKEG